MNSTKPFLGNSHAITDLLPGLLDQNNFKGLIEIIVKIVSKMLNNNNDVDDFSSNLDDALSESNVPPEISRSLVKSLNKHRKEIKNNHDKIPIIISKIISDYAVSKRKYNADMKKVKKPHKQN